MKYEGLELDLSDILKQDTCYVLTAKEAALAPFLSEHGVNYVVLEQDPPAGADVRLCKGEGTTGWTNLKELPKGWEFDSSKGLSVTNLRVSLEKSEHSLEADSSGEEHFVYGEVLIPDWTDAHGHTISAELVRKTSHDYMTNFQRIGLQHSTDVSSKVSILESYIAPVDFELAGSSIKKGTWMMGVRVNDPVLWSKIKAGDLTGFSIGGWGKVEAL